MEGKWEVVNSKQKKQQKQSQKAEKKQKDLLEKKKEQDEEKRKKKEEMQRFLNQYASASGIETSSLFSALVGMDETKQNKASEAKEKKNKESSFNPEEGEVLVFKDVNKKKQKSKQTTTTTEVPQQKEQKRPIEEIASSVDRKYVKKQKEELSERYPNDSNIQFVCFAEILEQLFNNSKQSKDYHSLPLHLRLEYPLKYIKRETIHEVEEWLHSIPKQSIQGICWILISTLQSIHEKKIESSCIGIEIVLSIISRYYSHSLFQNLELIKESFTRSDNDGYLSIIPKYSSMLLWICGQPIISHNFAVALTLWTDLFLPQLVKENSNVSEKTKDDFILFAELLAESTQKGHTYLDENGVATYEVLLNSKFNSSNVLSDRASKALSSISDFNSVFQKNTFSIKLFKLLLKYGTSDTESTRKEVSENLSLLLEREKRYFSVWKEQYLKHIPQSSNLLSHLLSGWSDGLHNYSTKISSEEMSSFISFVTSTNDSFAKSSKKLRASEKSAIEIIDQTLKVFERAIKKTGTNSMKSNNNNNNNNNNGNKSSGGFGIGMIGFITISSIAIGYTAFNCCYMEWCRQNQFLGKDLFHCNK